MNAQPGGRFPTESSCAPAAGRGSGGRSSQRSSPRAPSRGARARPGQVRALSDFGDSVVAVPGDATTRADNESLVTVAIERWGRIDVAVTFVGVFDLYTPLAEIPEERFDAAFDEVFGLNVKSPLLTARAALTALREPAARSSSRCRARASTPGAAARCTSVEVRAPRYRRPAGPRAGTRRARERRRARWTVATDLRGPRSLGLDGVRLDDRPGRVEELEARSPLGVALTGADHAGAYVFLASDASRGMTGEIVRSDGGLGVR